jgi:hypothetical protein
MALLALGLETARFWGSRASGCECRKFACLPPANQGLLLVGQPRVPSVLHIMLATTIEYYIEIYTHNCISYLLYPQRLRMVGKTRNVVVFVLSCAWHGPELQIEYHS